MAIRVNDVGTTLTATITDDDDAVVDISGATDMVFVFEKPDGEIIEKDGVFVTDGTDGKVKYVTVANDLDVAGLWHFQVFIDISNGDVMFNSEIEQFEVAANLQCS